MTFKDDMVTDMDVFFNTDEFATAATFNSNPISIIFDQLSDNFQVGDVDVIENRLEALVNQAEVPNIVVGDIIIVNSINHYVIDIDDQGETDSTGHMRLILSLEAP
jgi:hypothetical protein